MKKRILIDRKDMGFFSNYVKNKEIKFNIEINRLYCDSIYFNENNSAYLSWNALTDDKKTLINIVKMLNSIIKSHKLLFEGE